MQVSKLGPAGMNRERRVLSGKANPGLAGHFWGTSRVQEQGLSGMAVFALSLVSQAEGNLEGLCPRKSIEHHQPKEG